MNSLSFSIASAVCAPHQVLNILSMRNRSPSDHA
ncbi:hypothetical protein OKW40_001754 [Paraburkholderia sp. RAU6.4a]|nr:hypothetical protein [Paraburkholderia sp. HC6.4b]MBB5448685.1 hypothetical protein [Paraburkholderia sp. Kb1A]